MMKLYFPFPPEVRELFMYCWECWLCGGNGTQSGGLELHHILGRRKVGQYLDSAFNASVLCNECHSHAIHSPEYQRKLFDKTIDFLASEKYTPKEYDIQFVHHNAIDLNIR